MRIFTNAEDGTQALLMHQPDKRGDYRVIFRDIDDDKVIEVRFYNNEADAAFRAAFVSQTVED